MTTDNAGVKFLTEVKPLFLKYVKSASITTIEFEDGSTIGMRVFLKYVLGCITLKECL